MTIKQLEQLITISQQKSINKAADQLFISQPNLSYSLRSLEKEIGFSLFIRTPHGMELTPNGAVVLDDAYRILSLVSSWNALAKDGNDKKILLEGAGIIADHLLPHIISVCDFDHSGIMLEARENAAAALIENPPAEEGHSVILLDFFSIDKLEPAIRMAQKNGWNYRIIKRGQGSVLMNKNAPLANKEHLSVRDFSPFFIARDLYIEKNHTYNSGVDFFQYFDENKIITTSCRTATLQLVSMSENIISIGSFLIDSFSEYVADGSIISKYVDDFPMHCALIAFFHSTHNKAETEAILEKIEEITEALI